MEHESDGDTNCTWCAWYNLQRIDKGTGRLRNKRKSSDHPDYSIIKISQNTEKSLRLIIWNRIVNSGQGETKM